MGVVFEAEHTLLQKRVALKMLHADKARDLQISSRFAREAKISSQIKNPHIVDITDFGKTQKGDLYLVMEFLEGIDLATYLDKRGGLLDVPETKHILFQVAEALAAAHKAHVIHRDLKPDNIFLVPTENDPRYVKLLDFGIAKSDDGGGLTKNGMIIGTPEYMSPEQCEGKPVDPRSDVYALGIIAYQLFTGEVPFSHENFSQVLMMHGARPVVSPRKLRPELPVPAEATIMKCLQKKATDRFQSMDELKIALSTWGVTLQLKDDDEARTLIANRISSSVPNQPLPTLNLELAVEEIPEEEEATILAGKAMNLNEALRLAGEATMLPEEAPVLSSPKPNISANPPSFSIKNVPYNPPKPLAFPEDTQPAPALMEDTQPAEALMGETQPSPSFFEDTQPAPALMEESQPSELLMGETQPGPPPVLPKDNPSFVSSAINAIEKDLPQKTSSRLWVIIFSALVAAGLVALAIYLIWGWPVVPEKPQMNTAQTLPATTEVLPSTTQAQELVKITILIESEPKEGVDVRILGDIDLLATLPDEVFIPKGDKLITLQFSKEGFWEVLRDITPDQNQEVEITLTPKEP